MTSGIPSPRPPSAESSTPRLRWPLVALVSLGVWLHAADALVATTVMPSAVAEIGGLAFIYWTIALYQLGSIVAGALAGAASVRFGLRRAMSAAALVYALGCAAAALTPTMPIMLAGRLVQGLGGGAMMALSYVGVTQLFPERLWTRVLALVSSVWGISALVGPLVGGAFASVGLWRGAFWVFAAQAMVVVILTPFVDATATPTSAGSTIPGAQIAVLSAAVLAISFAGVQADLGAMIALGMAGVAALAVVLRLERHARQRLLPAAAFSITAPWAPGYVMILALATATASFTVYGPLIMAKLFHVLPIIAGFIVATESVAWTLAAIAVGRAGVEREPLLIRSGAILIVAGVAGLAVTMPRGPVAALLPWAMLQGAGFGLCWASLLRRLVASVPVGERDLASSAIPTLQMLGYALGAAASGMIANGLGLTEGAPDQVVRSVAFWVFAAFVPLGALGLVAAWRFAAPPVGVRTSMPSRL